VGQCDDIFVSVVYVPEVRNEGKDFGGDLVDWCQPVCPEPNKAENLNSVLFEGVELEHYARQSRSMRSVLLSNLSLAKGRHEPAKSHISPPA